MSFKPRLTKPEKGNKYYIRKAEGGYSEAIKGNPTDSDCNVLSNCVGYAYGRFNEIGGYGYCKYLCPVNAENFIQYKGNCTVGQTPKLGACMVWQKGATLSGSDGGGHVAIVEKIISETEVITSESGWNSAAFWTKTRVKGDGNWGQNANYKFLGFIYNPAVKDEPVPPATKIKVGDIVTFTGNTHYISANSKNPKPCKGGKAEVTLIYKPESSLHPYHLICVTGSGANVWGFVDAKDIAELNTPKEEKKDENWTPKIGDIVTFTGNTHYFYSNSTNPKPCVGGKAKITDLYPSGKHPFHLIRISGGGSNVYGWVDKGTFVKG